MGRPGIHKVVKKHGEKGSAEVGDTRHAQLFHDPLLASTHVCHGPYASTFQSQVGGWTSEAGLPVISLLARAPPPVSRDAPHLCRAMYPLVVPSSVQQLPEPPWPGGRDEGHYFPALQKILCTGVHTT
jgi:hypothetical protein